MLENATRSTHSGDDLGVGKQCTDTYGKVIPQGVHFVPGPDECTLCVCDEGGPKWCKAVLCAPPQDCKSFRVGNSCCDFICLDDSFNKGKGGGGPGGVDSVDLTDVIPKVVIAAVTAMLSLSLLFFLVHRLRQREIQGRLNSEEARRSRQMCDECDDTRSLDYSMYDFDRSPPTNAGHIFPPQYLAWWKPPSSYFPPRCEAPPPYEEAIASTSNCVPSSFLTVRSVNEAINTTILTNENINGRSEVVVVPTRNNLNLNRESITIIPKDSENTRITELGSNTEPVAGPSSGQIIVNGLSNESTEEDEVEPKDLLPSYNEVSLVPGRDCFRHSLTLPRRPNLQEMREFGLDLEGANYYRNGQQRLSLQLNVADWSSSSSTISLSMSTPTMGCRVPSLTSSSSSSSNNTN